MGSFGDFSYSDVRIGSVIDRMRTGIDAIVLVIIRALLLLSEVHRHCSTSLWCFCGSEVRNRAKRVMSEPAGGSDLRFLVVMGVVL